MINLKTDISFFQFDSHNVLVTVKKKDFDGIEIPFVLDNTVIYLSIKDKDDSGGSVLAALSSADSSEIEITDSANGIFVIHFNKTNTGDKVSVGTFFYDIIIVGDEFSYTVKKNKIEFFRPITVLA